MIVKPSQRRLLIVSNVSHHARKWKWLYRWMDDNCIHIGKQMTKPHYRSVSTLERSQVTQDAFVTRVRYLAKTVGTRALDVFLNVHGRRDSLKFADGWARVDHVTQRIGDLGLGHRLRLLYSTACYGGLHAPRFVDAGFKTASGAKRINANGTYDFPAQISKWRDGQTYASAVKAGNNSLMISVHDNLAELMGFDDVNSEKVIAGVRGVRITSPAD